RSFVALSPLTSTARRSLCFLLRSSSLHAIAFGAPRKGGSLSLSLSLSFAMEHGSATDSSSSTFSLMDEDHTLANSVRYTLNQE
ncbi:hypothetical protein BHM03_00040898, partial [Ensete ventricosum]